MRPSLSCSTEVRGHVPVLEGMPKTAPGVTPSEAGRQSLGTGGASKLIFLHRPDC